jgi:glycosyltransferase involved in cell wall biosynthesis
MDSENLAWLPDLERSGGPVRFLDTDGRLRLSRRVRSVLSESAEPTILHTHFTSFDVAAALAAVRQPSARVVWHMQSPARTDPVGRVRGVVRNGVLGRLVDQILCVAPDRAEAAIAEGAPRDRVRFFPNAIDTSAFAPATPDERAAARNALGLDGTGAVLLHFGWDWDRKGGDVFLRAVRALLDRGRDVTAVSVGAGGPAGELARTLGLGDALVLRPAGAQVQRVFAAADVFASPSRAEGMPFSVLEALASGVPVAASDIPGQAAIGAGIAACRITPLEPLEHADAIAGLLDRPDAVAAAERAAAIERVRAEYDLSVWADRLLGVYEELFAASSSS